MEIQASAAKAMSEWQTFFAGQSMERAKEIARTSGVVQISKAHLAKAALETIEKLVMEIQPEAVDNDDRRAA